MVAALSVDMRVRRIHTCYEKYKFNNLKIPNSYNYCMYTTFHLDNKTLSSVCLTTAVTEIKSSAFASSSITDIFIPS